MDSTIPYKYKARLVRVIDGDTIVLDVDLGMKVTVRETFRLYGIDTPETFGVKKDSEEYRAGILAKDRIYSLLSPISTSDYILIETIKDSKEKYGRYLAKAYYRSAYTTHNVIWANLNDVLILEGLAKPYLS